MAFYSCKAQKTKQSHHKPRENSLKTAARNVSHPILCLVFVRVVFSFSQIQGLRCGLPQNQLRKRGLREREQSRILEKQKILEVFELSQALDCFRKKLF